jgi:hypothetical protein
MMTGISGVEFLLILSLKLVVVNFRGFRGSRKINKPPKEVFVLHFGGLSFLQQTF